MRSNLRDKDEKPGYGIYEITKDSILVYTQRIGEPKKKWAAFSLTESYYDRNGKADKYPDFSVNKEYAQVKEQWLVQTGSRHLLFAGCGKWIKYSFGGRTWDI